MSRYRLQAMQDHLVLLPSKIYPWRNLQTCLLQFPLALDVLFAYQQDTQTTYPLEVAYGIYPHHLL